MATFCPICRRDVSRWDVPSANILSNLPTFCPICILDKMFLDGSARLPTGQNVGRWAVPSADGPIWLHFAQSADGTSHLPTFCPICQHFVQSAYWTKWSQMGHPVCRRDKMLADEPSHLPTGTHRQMGRKIRD